MRSIRRRLAILPSAAALTMTLAALPAGAGQYQPGGEFRGYPSGEIISGSLGTDLGHNYYGALSVSYNFAQRGNNGEHDEEHGGGIGGGLTIDKYFRPNQVGWFVGGRAEIFGLNINYRDDFNTPNGRVRVRGDSDIIVFQPTIRGGYAWAFGEGHYGVQLGLSFGGEINVSTKGEDVGDGPIVLGGVAFTFRP